MGVDPKRIYLDHGLTGTKRGDTLVVTKLDRLARSVPDAATSSTSSPPGGVRLNIGGSVHDPTDPIGRLLFNTQQSHTRLRRR